MTKPKAQTISELYEFLQENMATKKDLAETRESLQKQLNLLSSKVGQQDKKTTKSFHELYHFLQEKMATKNDIGAVTARMDSFERNYVHNDVFTDFRDQAYNKLDEIIGKLDARDVEDVATEGGLKRVEKNMENHAEKIKANRQDIDRIKFNLKIA